MIRVHPLHEIAILLATETNLRLVHHSQPYKPKGAGEERHNGSDVRVINRGMPSGSIYGTHAYYMAQWAQACSR